MMDDERGKNSKETRFLIFISYFHLIFILLCAKLIAEIGLPIIAPNLYDIPFYVDENNLEGYLFFIDQLVAILFTILLCGILYYFFNKFQNLFLLVYVYIHKENRRIFLYFVFIALLFFCACLLMFYGSHRGYNERITNHLLILHFIFSILTIVNIYSYLNRNINLIILVLVFSGVSFYVNDIYLVVSFYIFTVLRLRAPRRRSAVIILTFIFLVFLSFYLTYIHDYFYNHGYYGFLIVKYLAVDIGIFSLFFLALANINSKIILYFIISVSVLSIGIIKVYFSKDLYMPLAFRFDECVSEFSITVPGNGKFEFSYERYPRIFDINGNLIAGNGEKRYIVRIPSNNRLLKSESIKERLADSLKKLADRIEGIENLDELMLDLSEGNSVKLNLSLDQISLLFEKNIQLERYSSFRALYSRLYPYGEAVLPLIGFRNIDGRALGGIEKILDWDVIDSSYHVVDSCMKHASNSIFKSTYAEDVKSIYSESDMVLEVDIHLINFLSGALYDELDDLSVENAEVAVVNLDNNSLLAVSTYPNPEHFSITPNTLRPPLKVHAFEYGQMIMPVIQTVMVHNNPMLFHISDREIDIRIATSIKSDMEILELFKGINSFDEDIDYYKGEEVALSTVNSGFYNSNSSFLNGENFAISAFDLLKAYNFVFSGTSNGLKVLHSDDIIDYSLEIMPVAANYVRDVNSYKYPCDDLMLDVQIGCFYITKPLGNTGYYGAVVLFNLSGVNYLAYISIGKNNLSENNLRIITNKILNKLILKL